MTYGAIETYYAGCRFRSRLEARWAVFFDAARIRWDYEPQGFVNAYGQPYLPDFYLPDVWSPLEHADRDGSFTDKGIYVEVKGSDQQLYSDWERIGNSVDYRATPCSQGLLLLGPIPQVPSLFPIAYWREGVAIDLIEPSFLAFTPEYACEYRYWTSADGCDVPECDGVRISVERVSECCDVALEMPYVQARQARFEHGERGARVR